jgi:GNAT superfamily N-acetyltransferase
VYRTTREAELGLTGWSEAEKAAFIEMQFAAQDRSYREAYPHGRFLVVLRDGKPAGRLYFVRLVDEVRLVDITLLPAHRGIGIGTSLIAAVQAEADAVGLPTRLHVELRNPAKRLYERLGFRTVEQRGVHELMERPAGGSG